MICTSHRVRKRRILDQIQRYPVEGLTMVWLIGLTGELPVSGDYSIWVSLPGVTLLYLEITIR